MRICLVASSRFPITEPFQGGLEAHTATLAVALRDRGHAVTVFAAPGSDPALGVEELRVPTFRPSAAARADVGARPDEWMQEHHAYLALMLSLARDGHERFDLVHNNSLHHLPVAMASALRVPVLTTLHTPPLGWLESAMTLAPPHAAFAAVSRHTAAAWSHAVRADVVPNGVDTGRWHAGPGGERAVWTGRLVPEKAPHLAVAAARRAGLAIDLAGPVLDTAYVRREVEPLLGDDARLLGHLGTEALRETVGRARVALVTPQWDEPYGLVAAEAMACGTPVAAFARGALGEVVGVDGGRLARPGDVDDLARAVREACDLDRSVVRAHAVRHCSVERMVERYEDLYRRVVAAAQPMGSTA
jgi:glycosyltransferase involved in cell wall biosynthesis